ncbi:hypothetical protein KGM_204869 [Danaus plexippus plexippus]|uniref:Uncharacterized protein n=1 Tax=Danaus plexippus plexippus TaxID=278856 RepID=A0A212FGC8_DANPL|nr:hypothetical protein KGM_204869 [Danaus plexippus plexippus]
MKLLRLVQEQDIMEEELVVLELVMALELRPLEQPLLQPVQWHGLIVRSENYKMGRNGPQPGHAHAQLGVNADIIDDRVYDDHYR